MSVSPLIAIGGRYSWVIYRYLYCVCVSTVRYRRFDVTRWLGTGNYTVSVSPLFAVGGLTLLVGNTQVIILFLCLYCSK